MSPPELVSLPPLPSSSGIPHSPTPTSPLPSSPKPPPTLSDRIESGFITVVQWVPFVIIFVLMSWSLHAFIHHVGRLMETNSIVLSSHHHNFRIPVTIIIVILWCLTISAYLRVVFTSPGHPSLSLLPSHISTTTTITPTAITIPSDDSIPLVSISNPVPILVKRNGEQRFCRKCFLPKPDRAHHCRVCKRCILKMDHHCPWVVNCVGFANYKFFLLFILYLSCYCIVIFGFTINFVFVSIDLGPYDQFVTAVQILALSICSFLFGIVLTGFFIYHLTLLFTNRTTIESMENPHYSVNSHRNDNHTNTNPWDLGWRQNWSQVFGPYTKVWLWFVPISSHLGDGHSFPIAIPSSHGEDHA